MIELANEIARAAVHPLTEPTGWQAFAYGLLGLKTLRKAVNSARSIVNNEPADTADTSDDNTNE